ncbi:hypothetical protein P167DRAFT_202073 [Morchella conica CCBAS932]|uniref:Uncharacterized protein n=1 Tax=Morchella conica CCBAS932 TaxID=1392247 RepID=A0A3N4L8L4_9PEZI|nr:hypothetical protein P167DRAFT_202073 [Morchella conica CCBAS932]
MLPTPPQAAGEDAPSRIVSPPSKSELHSPPPRTVPMKPKNYTTLYIYPEIHDRQSQSTQPPRAPPPARRRVKVI